jgi:hypothetical protein
VDSRLCLKTENRDGLCTERKPIELVHTNESRLEKFLASRELWIRLSKIKNSGRDVARGGSSGMRYLIASQEEQSQMRVYTRGNELSAPRLALFSKERKPESIIVQRQRSIATSKNGDGMTYLEKVFPTVPFHWI